MGSAVALPEVEDVKTAKGLLQKVKPSLLVASGLQHESQIDLYVLAYEEARQASVFIYPAWYDLCKEDVLTLHPGFSDVAPRMISREFKDASVEELDRVFLEQIRPMISFMDRLYLGHKPRIIEHCYPEVSAVYIVGVIRDLEIEEEI